MTAYAALVLIAAPLCAQARPDFSGRWRLVQPTTAELALDTLTITAADQLVVTDTPREIVITHLGNAGTHPEAGTFEYGSGGFVGGLPGGELTNGQWGTTYIGRQLMISRSLIMAPNERGVRATLARGSIWRLEAPDRLVIEFGEERSGERPKIATRVYVRVRTDLLHPGLRRPYSFFYRWVGIEKCLDEFRWTVFGEILPAEASHGGDKRGWILRHLQSVRIGAPLV